MQIGLLERTPRGRKVTHRAWEHLGKKPAKTQPSLL
jgi:Holliday junction DNA helicase RuvB